MGFRFHRALFLQNMKAQNRKQDVSQPLVRYPTINVSYEISHFNQAETDTSRVHPISIKGRLGLPGALSSPSMKVQNWDTGCLLVL